MDDVTIMGNAEISQPSAAPWIIKSSNKWRKRNKTAFLDVSLRESPVETGIQARKYRSFIRTILLNFRYDHSSDFFWNSVCSGPCMVDHHDLFFFKIKKRKNRKLPLDQALYILLCRSIQGHNHQRNGPAGIPVPCLRHLDQPGIDLFHSSAYAKILPLLRPGLP